MPSKESLHGIAILICALLGTGQLDVILGLSDSTETDAIGIRGWKDLRPSRDDMLGSFLEGVH